MERARSSITRRSAVGAIAATAIAAVRPPAARGEGLTTVRIGSSLADDTTPALYAMHAGIFQKAGLDVQLTVSSSGAAMATAVAGGSIDFAKSTLLGLITAYSHGVHFKIVAGAGVFDASAPTGQLVVLKDSPIKTMADANGKTISTNALQSLDTLGIQALIDKQGGNSASVKFIELPYPSMFASLQQGRIDIASIATPVLGPVVASGQVRVLGSPFEAFGSRYMIGAWFCSRDYAARNASVVQRFADSIRQSATYTNAHPADTVTLLADYSHVDPALIKTMHRLQSATSIDPATIQRIIDAASKYGLIDKTFAAADLV